MRVLIFLVFATLTGCDDTLYGKPIGEGGGGEGGEGEGEGEGEDWCAVQNIFNGECTLCHTGASASGDLDLATDPYSAIVSQPSSLYDGHTLVVPGDASGSFLYLKVSNAQASGEGTGMPPMDGLDADAAATIQAWIDAGATTDCEGTVDTSITPSEYHPDGFEDPAVHGLQAKLQVQECADCHGADLTGSGEAVSCDSCHEAGWRTNCTRCHGGTDNTTGAPPVDIDDESDPGLISFAKHTIHLSDTEIKDAFACETCHQVPEDVLSPGHIFVDDDTPAVAEMDFSGGLSPAGTWDGAGTCSNLYCHGDGQGDNGTVSVSESADECASCHPHQDDRDAWEDMSGAHEKHLEEGSGFECGDCHKAVVDFWEPIIDTSLHVNGTVDIQLVGGMDWSEDRQTCDGECHYEEHDNRWWFDD